MSDIFPSEYIQNLEMKTKVLADYFNDDLRRAEETNDFSIVKHRLPLILDVISVYDDLGKNYYSQTCSDFLGMVARIQKGLGMNDECRDTLTALNQYQKGVEFQDTSLNTNLDTSSADSNLNPAMY